jgi:hypothetical protein
MPTARRAREQQAVGCDHAVHADGVHAHLACRRSLAIDQRARSPIAIAGQLGNLLLDLGEQLRVGRRLAVGTAVDP